MSRVAALILIPLAAYLYFPVSNFIIRGHVFDYLQQLNAEKCEFISMDNVSDDKTEHGIQWMCEDAYFDDRNSEVILSCIEGENKKTWFPGAGVFEKYDFAKDSLFLYNPRTNSFKKMYVYSDLKVPYESLHLHGIDGIQIEAPAVIGGSVKDRRLVASIQHQAYASTVVFFENLSGSSDLKYLGTLKNDAIHSPNDVAFISETEVVITNDHYFKKGPMRLVEELLQIPNGNLVYCSFERRKFIEDTSLLQHKCKILVSGLLYPNGVAYFDDTIYVALTTEPAIRTYTLFDNAIAKFEYVIPVGYLIDNLTKYKDHVTNETTIYAASHGKILPLLAQISPSLRKPLQFLQSKGLLEKNTYSVLSKIVEDKKNMFYGHPLKEQVLMIDNGSVTGSTSVFLKLGQNEYLAGNLVKGGITLCKNLEN
ncbi:hypothetical protein MP638_006713 [Amoeboaphelidium occidentale]|nr:hypothetical protein MP638_006713 [Amoeboaphelidium occidentale]